MSPKELRRRIRSSPAIPPITTAFRIELAKLGTPDSSFERYSSQKEHWLRWLEEYDGPGYYGRQNCRRTAQFVYNHINCPSMLLWLCEASGIEKATIHKAKASALRAEPTFPSQSKAIRQLVPWRDIEARMKTRDKSTNRGAPKLSRRKPASQSKSTQRKTRT
jgi:hypothetical protein